ncbi:S-layer homology domain-containing protein [Cohnella sp. GCM10027633]|uniref:S-layer homology domain-containing protein n=1 Tax=unclassified Cohnella TaxID=2636738 RepID=UPI003635719D
MLRGQRWIGRRAAALGLSVAVALGMLPYAGTASADGAGGSGGSGGFARFAGEPAEWAAIDYDSVSTAGTLQLLKTVQRDGKLYALVEGSAVRAEGVYYLDADNNAATGFASPYWSNAGGIDYRIVGGALQKYEGGSWTDAGIAQVARTPERAELAVDLALIGLGGAGGTVKVSYAQESDNSYLPDPGKTMLDTTPEAAAYGPDPLVSIDAETSDWAAFEPLARSEDGLTALYAAMNNERLSVLVTGKMGDWNDVFIDVDDDNATGFTANWLWKGNNGFDFMFENGSLYANDGGGFAWGDGPLVVEGLQYAAAGGNDDKVIEMSVPLAGLGLEPGMPVHIGFSGANRYTPSAAAYAVKVVPSLPRVTVDGDGSEWAGIEPIGTGVGNAQKLSAFVKSDTLYVLAQGASLSGEKNLFINTDNDPATGHQGWQYARTGADYLVQNGSAYRSTGTGWSWDPAAEVGVTSVVYSVYAPPGTELLEMAVDLGSVAGLSGTVRVALGVGDAYAPAAGSVAEYPIALTASGGEIVLDGANGDWSIVDNKATSGVATLSLKAVKDNDRLILLAEGSDMNAQNDYYIDSDGNAATGWSESAWTGAGIDYKISRNTLYRYDGAGGWTAAGSVYNKPTATYDLVYARLGDMGATPAAAMKVAYVSKNAIALPARGGDMLAVDAVIEEARESAAYYPLESYEALNNPFMGWAAWSRDSHKEVGESYAQPHSLVYAGITWRELEPVKGEFAWDAIEEKYQFDYWTGLGKRFNLRIVLDLPGTDPSHKDIPDWLYDELVAAETESGAGKWYDSSAVGSGFAPNYSSPVLIAEHERMIAALADRYDGDSRIAHVQIGSLGHWGEFHNWPEEESGAFPKLAVSDQYVQHYIDNFEHALLGMRKPFPIAAANGFGLFNDIIGDGETQTWLRWIEQGWDQISGYVNQGQDPAQVQADSRMPDFWKTNFSGGEFTSGNPLLSINDEKFMTTLEQIRASHTSWIGPAAPADYVVGSGGVTQDIQENMTTLLTTMGYRFVLESVSHEASAAPGTAIDVDTTWVNRGLAPFYREWPVALALSDAWGNLVPTSVTKATYADIRDWLPGEHETTLKLNVPSSLAPGSYKVLVGILDPGTDAPGVKLAIEGQRSDGWYALDALTVTGNGGGTVYVPPSNNGVQDISNLPAHEAGGPVSVALDGGKSEARLPLGQLIDAGAPLVLRNDALELELPKELLQSLGGGDVTSGAQLVFGWKKLDSAQTATGSATVGVYTAAGEAFELTLGIRAPGGTVTPVTTFGQPVKLTLKLAPGADPQLAAIYYLPEGGEPEYVGGKATGGRITASLMHFSAYAALEWKREFADVPADHWAHGAIQRLAAHRIVNGTGEDAFAPGRSLTRAEFAAMLARALGLKPTGAQPAFKDVVSGSTFAEAIQAAADAGIVAGQGNGRFAPNAAITREEAAVMLDRALKAAGKQAKSGGLEAFDDRGDVSAWALEAIGKLANGGVLQGVAPGKLKPQGVVDRAQMAVMLSRWLDLI